MADPEQLIQQMNELTGALNLLMDRNANFERRMAELGPRPPNPTEFYKIPDPIKTLQAFDGKTKHLNQWLSAAEDTLRLLQDGVTAQQYRVYFQAVLNKIEGKARDIICLSGDIQNFDEVKTILINALGDRQEMSYYKSQLWQTKMTEDTTIHKYYSNKKTTIQNIKALAKQNVNYNANWATINQFIEEDALAAFIAGLRKPYFGYAQASKPKDVEEAYAFLCKFTSHEKTASKANNNKWSIAKTNNSFNNGNKNKPPPLEPMDVDPSLRSRMTLNRKPANNNEDIEEPSDSEEDEPASDTDDDISVNFWTIQEPEKPI